MLVDSGGCYGTWVDDIGCWWIMIDSGGCILAPVWDPHASELLMGRMNDWTGRTRGPIQRFSRTGKAIVEMSVHLNSC